MCGIAGVISFGRPVPAGHIRSATQALRHRGPDDEGYLGIHPANGAAVPFGGADSRLQLPDIAAAPFLSRFWLGHRRLAIIDTSAAGHQPMASPDGKKWLVYNGEIYNFRPLRQELIRSGHAFSSQTDSEVILAAYDRWGEGCLQRFNGMWAMAILDLNEKTLFLARDRTGVKPLYFFRSPDHLVFASEIKAILACPFVGRGINREIIFDYLALGYEDREPQTAFQDIHELLPAQRLLVDLAGRECSIKKYYQLAYATKREAFAPGRFAECREGVRERLQQAVKIRLHADVPLGSCLSGGIDSSAIVCLCDALLRQGPIAAIGDRQRVFTACFPDAAIDEAPYARTVAARTGASWIPVQPQVDELSRDLEDLVFFQELPFGSTSVYAQYRIMKAAQQEGIKVMMDGQGADELFAGYRQFFPPFLHEMLTRFLWRDLAASLRGIANSPLDARRLLAGVLKNIIKRITPAGIKSCARRRAAEKSGLLNRDFCAAFEPRYHKGIQFEYFSLNEMLADFVTSFQLRQLLRYEDRNSMRFAIEARTPFADDKDLIEYVFQIPAAYKIHDGWSKYLLRQALAGVVPDEILQRRDKIAFATPESAWLGRMKGSLRQYVSPRYREYIDIDALEKNWDAVFAGLTDSGFSQVWRIFNFLIWARLYGL